MNREQAKEAAKVMLAWSEGKEIQYKHRQARGWIDFSEPRWPVGFNWNTYDYRIKPEKKIFVRWVNIYSDHDPVFHSTKENANKFAGSNRVACIHFVKEYEEGEGL